MRNLEVHKRNLSQEIEESRIILNEICRENDRTKTEIRLAISRQLDDLIVEYMQAAKTKKQV